MRVRHDPRGFRPMKRDSDGEARCQGVWSAEVKARLVAESNASDRSCARRNAHSSATNLTESVPANREPCARRVAVNRRQRLDVKTAYCAATLHG